MSTKESYDIMILTTLDKISIGTKARIQCVDNSLLCADRLRDLGFTTNTLITPLFCSPISKTKAYYIKGSILAIRCKDAKKIKVLTTYSGDYNSTQSK